MFEKGFEVVIGKNVTTDTLEENTGEVYENKPLCTPISYFGIPILIIELVKSILIIRKFYSQVKVKYINAEKKKYLVLSVLKSSKDLENTSPKVKRSNTLPNMDTKPAVRNSNKRKLSIQRNINCEKIKPFQPTIPRIRLLFETLETYLFRSNFIILCFISFVAFCFWFSIGFQTPFFILTAEMACAYYIPIFLFYSESGLRKICRNQLSKVIPLDI